MKEEHKKVEKVQEDDDKEWMEDFAKRGHLLTGPVEHISILLEDVPRYVKDPAFTHNKIRDVMTIGRVLHKQYDILIITPCLTEISDTIYAYLHESYLRANQEIRHNRVHARRVQENEVYKFYGSLRYEEDLIILDVHLILGIDNINECLEILTLTSQLCNQHYYEYNHSEEMEDLISDWWDDVTRKRKGITEKAS